MKKKKSWAQRGITKGYANNTITIARKNNPEPTKN